MRDRFHGAEAISFSLGETLCLTTLISCDASSFIRLWSELGLNGSRAHGFHLFRHSAASIVHALTSELKLAQELLGHSTISTTADIYIHTLDEAKAGLATELLASELIQ